MKKRVFKYVFGLLAVCGLAFSGTNALNLSNNNNETSGGSPVAPMAIFDYSWYDENEDHFQINSASQLAGLTRLASRFEEEFEGGTNFAGKTITLTDNIDLSVDHGITWRNNQGWLPIGERSDGFQGIFDGNGFTISGLFIDGSHTNAGLFATVGGGGEVKNLILDDVKINNTNASGTTGGLAGTLGFGADVVGVAVSGDIEGINIVGGIVGTMSSIESIMFCRADVNVFSRNTAGGIAGISAGIISHCVVFGTVTVDVSDFNYTRSYYYAAGGIVGVFNSLGEIVGNYVFADVVSNKQSGGVAGILMNPNAEITNNVVFSQEIIGDMAAGIATAHYSYPMELFKNNLVFDEALIFSFDDDEQPYPVAGMIAFGGYDLSVFNIFDRIVLGIGEFIYFDFFNEVFVCLFDVFDLPEHLKINLDDARIEVSGTYTFNGSAQTPNFVIWFGEDEDSPLVPLLQGIHYVLNFNNNNNTNAGRVNFTVEGRDLVRGEKASYFDIAPRPIEILTFYVDEIFVEFNFVEGRKLSDIPIKFTHNFVGEWTFGTTVFVWETTPDTVLNVPGGNFPIELVENPANHIFVLPDTPLQIAITVKKVEPPVPTLTGVLGQTLADITLPTGWTWDNPDEELTILGQRHFKASFAESGNFLGMTSVDVSVYVSEEEDEGVPLGVIVGVSIGGAAAVLGGLAGAYLSAKKKKIAKQEETEYKTLDEEILDEDIEQ
jgi:hypothetical protein